MSYKNLVLLFLFATCFCFGQQDQSITSMDFVEIIDNNDEEAWYYYENNWKVLRQMAVKKDYILSFKLFKDLSLNDNTFGIVLMTNYKDSLQFINREAHFQELIKEKGELRLLNDKLPGEFRKTIYSKDFSNQ